MGHLLVPDVSTIPPVEAIVSPPQTCLSLSMSLRPVPSRFVSQIWARQFIEMRDLLGDNTVVGRHVEDICSSMGASLVQVSPRVREVTSMNSWLVCFLTFLVVGTSDTVTRERLAYAVLIIRESLRHGGMGWLEYDRLFCQQAALNPNLPWNCMDPGLQASTTLAQRTPTGGLFCTLCQDCDHVAPQCALAQLQQQVVRPSSVSTSGPSSRFPSFRVCHS